MLRGFIIDPGTFTPRTEEFMARDNLTDTTESPKVRSPEEAPDQFFGRGQDQ